MPAPVSLAMKIPIKKQKKPCGQSTHKSGAVPSFHRIVPRLRECAHHDKGNLDGGICAGPTRDCAHHMHFI
jgi:hypothetical protein